MECFARREKTPLDFVDQASGRVRTPGNTSNHSSAPLTAPMGTGKVPAGEFIVHTRRLCEQLSEPQRIHLFAKFGGYTTPYQTR